MNFRSPQFWLPFILALLASAAATDENCQISDQELQKIDNVLTNINQPIYAEEEREDASDDDECAYLLNGIHLQLRRLTHKFKLMNKGYVKEVEFRKMAKDYDAQLSKLREDLKHFKVSSRSSLNQKMEKLMANIKELEQNISKLHKDLEGVTDEYDQVQKELCFTYLESNQIQKAKEMVKKIKSKYVLEIVAQLLEKNKGTLLPVVDFSAAIPDLDDRGQAYKTIHQFLHTRNLMEGEDCLLLEAEIQKMNATLSSGSKITDDRKKEMEELLSNMSSYSKKIIDQWILDLNNTKKSALIKNALDRMYLNQMESFGEQITARRDFYSVRNLLKLLVVSSNFYKIAAYQKLIEKKVGHSMGIIMINMISMEKTGLKYDPHVPYGVEKMYHETLESLPTSLKNIRSCLKRVKIHNQDTNQCIVAIDQKLDVKHPNPNVTTFLGKLKRVTTKPNDCSTFRLEPSSDDASIKIVTSGGDALTNINSAVPGQSGFNQVGAPYTNNRGKLLEYSQDWILDANFDNSSIKIESEFNAYWVNKSIDHLVIRDVDGDRQPVVARYGMKGLGHSGVNMKLTEWRIECA